MDKDRGKADRDAERCRAERILGAVAQAMKGGRSACLFGMARKDGEVIPWMDGAPPWPCMEAFLADARGKGKATALLECRRGEGHFGTGVVLPSGVVVEAEGRRRRWGSVRAFLKDAGTMGACLVRWCPARRTRRAASPEDARQ